MKRDMDLIRKILFQVENHSEPMGFINIDIDGIESSLVSYHVKILADAGLVEAKNLTTNDGFKWSPTSLTWAGHDFLDAARDDTVWNETKAITKNAVSSVSFDVLKQMLSATAMRFMEGYLR